MTRGGRRKDRTGTPERRCIATGEVRPVTELVRFVVGPDGQIVPDLRARLPGRGIWVSADRKALEKAVAKNLFARAARQPVTVPEGLLDRIEAQLAERVVQLISLARKAGQAVAGYEKVKDWLAKEEARVLIQAIDGSERGKSKLRTPCGGCFIGCLTGSELGLAFGRENVIHIALAGSGLTSRVVEEAAKLSGIRNTTDGGTARRKGTKTI
ncbi:MAG: hypothetical protein CSA74_05475 [Rhodobacterales bacterium]|nr:MAG: hypothetical protein CSA74_05475 [Rhodobacterales bacterium]